MQFLTRLFRIFENALYSLYRNKIKALLVGIGVFIFSILIGVTTISADQIAMPVAASPSALPSADTLSPVSSLSPSLPAKINIPKIGASASVKAMGLTAANKMAVPNNFTDVGWLKTSVGGVLPGTPGNAVIGAHVDNGGVDPTIKGVFKDLHMLVPGDDIYIIDTNGATLHFKVTTTKIYPYNSTATSKVFGSSNASHLNLITCYGTWLPSAGTYNKRLVVFATRV